MFYAQTMLLIYIKLNDYDYLKCRLPLGIAGFIYDGMEAHPILLPLQGHAVFFSHKPIAEADREFLTFTGERKLPPDVVVQIKA